MPGFFIDLEGPEGCGKTCISKFLKEKLTSMGHEVVLTFEPGDTDVGAAIRKILLDGEQIPIPECEALLFFADRAQHVVKVILPALTAGKVVVCDRYCFSTFAHQGYARGLDLEALKMINEFAIRFTMPDLVILLDVPTEIGLARKKDMNRLDKETVEYHRMLWFGYLKMFQEYDNWVVVNSNRPKEEVQEEVWRKVQEALQRKGA